MGFASRIPRALDPSNSSVVDRVREVLGTLVPPLHSRGLLDLARALSTSIVPKMVPISAALVVPSSLFPAT